MIYAVQAAVTEHDGTWTRTSHTPTFYLDSNVQGITSEEHAETIGRSIVNPTERTDIEVHVSAVEVGDIRLV